VVRCCVDVIFVDSPSVMRRHLQTDGWYHKRAVTGKEIGVVKSGEKAACCVDSGGVRRETSWICCHHVRRQWVWDYEVWYSEVKRIANGLCIVGRRCEDRCLPLFHIWSVQPQIQLHQHINQICGLLGYYAASCGNCLPTFRDNGHLTREDGTDTLSLNVGKQLPHDAV
jgi:hypothetical protein